MTVFVTVNLLLMPLAYIKTIIHKILLFKTYRGKEQLRNIAIYFFLGIPFLLCA